MIHFAWPWMLLCLPLPWLAARLLPPAAAKGGALFLPFAAQIKPVAATAARVATRWRVALFALLWLLLVGAATRPQWLGDPLELPSAGRRLMLAIDTSGSMAAKDMAGGRTRLGVVQTVAGEFIRQRKGDQVGLILFGTRPYLQAPLTADLDTVGQFLREAMIGVAGPQTAIGDAIGLAIKRFKSQQAQSGKDGDMVLVLLTDGANDAGLMAPVEAAKIAAAEGLRIYTIGVGALPQSGLFNTGGNSGLDETTLKAIAKVSRGVYFRAGDAAALQDVVAQIDTLEPGSGKSQWYRPSTEWFPWPLALALLLSVPAVLMRDRT